MRNIYIYRNYYSVDSHLEFTGKIPLVASSRTVTFKMYADLEKLLDLSAFCLCADEGALPLFVHYNENINYDGYRLDITEKEISVEARNARGIRYAFHALNNIVVKKGEKFLLPVALIEDWPDFVYRGIIEGYYGKPWGNQERAELADFMDKNRLNTYMYAPKQDPYHRRKWYQLYPEDIFKDIIKLINNLKEKDINFFYCIAPGYAEKPDESFRFLGNEDYERLFVKLEQLISAGVDKFALLMDDIDYQLCPKDKLVFERPGIAHAHLANRINQYLCGRLVRHKLILCPTEYSQIGATQYRHDLKRLLDEDIYIFWTGDNVCAEAITGADAERTKQAYNRELFIWDNFPVSDFTHGVREYIAPIQNRSSDLGRYARGYFINPSNNYYIAQAAMTTMAHYAWNNAKYDPLRSFIIALDDIHPDLYKSGCKYFQYNFPSVLSYGRLEYERLLAEKGDQAAIIAYYADITESVGNLLKLDITFIHQLRPWLLRTLKEADIVEKILNESITRNELLKFLEDIKFSGSELFDYLVEKHGLLDAEQYEALINNRRGSKWYRVFEKKRWPKR